MDEEFCHQDSPFLEDAKLLLIDQADDEARVSVDINGKKKIVNPERERVIKPFDIDMAQRISQDFGGTNFHTH